MVINHCVLPPFPIKCFKDHVCFKDCVMTVWVTGQDDLACLFTLHTGLHWVKYPINRDIYIRYLLCEHAATRNHWEWVEQKDAKFRYWLLTGHFTFADIFERRNLLFYYIYHITYILKSKSTVLVYTECHPHQQWFLVKACLIRHEQAPTVLHNAGKVFCHAL